MREQYMTPQQRNDLRSEICNKVYRSCDRKIRYAHQSDALRNVDRLKDIVPTITSYRCPVCLGWHIGKASIQKSSPFCITIDGPIKKSWVPTWIWNLVKEDVEL